MNDEYEYGVRAYVQRSFRHFDGVEIWLAEKRGGVTSVGQNTDIVFAPPAEAAAYSEPTLLLPEGVARSLLDALAAHYGGAGDFRTLRRDYEAERKRVDGLIEHLARRLP